MLNKLGSLDGTMEHRLHSVELGVQELDRKVSALDNKMQHSIDIQGEMYSDQREKFGELSSHLKEQQDELKKWQKQLKGNMGGNLRFWATMFSMAGWLILMIYLWIIHG